MNMRTNMRTNMRASALAVGSVLAVLGVAGCTGPEDDAALPDTPGLVSTTTVPVSLKAAAPTYTAPTATWTPPPPAPILDNEFPSSTLDRLFLKNLDEGGLVYAAPGQMVELARTGCAAFDAGATFGELSVVLKKNMRLWTYDDTGWFLGSAIGAYCPEHENKVPA